MCEVLREVCFCDAQVAERRYPQNVVALRVGSRKSQCGKHSYNQAFLQFHPFHRSFPWGYSESPLVDGGKLIVTPGGAAGCVVALDKRNGDVIWRSKDVSDKAHYASAIVVESHGVRQILQFTGGSGKKEGGRRGKSEPVVQAELDNAISPRIVAPDAETGHVLCTWRFSAELVKRLSMKDVAATALAIVVARPKTRREAQ